MPVANVVSGAQYYINYAGLQLTSNGLLGIGTINPTATLQVAGNVLFKDLVNSSTAFQVQNAAGTSILNVNTSTAQLTATGTLLVNNTTANDDQIQLSVTTGGAGKFTGIITNADLTANRTYTLPNESGTFCTTGSVCSGYAPSAASGYIQLAPSSAQGDTTTNNSIFINKTGATGDIINLQDSGTSVFRVKQGGDVSVGSSSAYGFTVNGRSFGLNGTLSASNGSFILDQTIANVDPFASFQNSGKFDLTTCYC